MHYQYTVFDMRVPEIHNLTRTRYWVEETCRRFKFGLEGVIHKEFKAPVPGPAFTLVGILSSSHVVIHTTPEAEWVEVAFACCRDIPLKELTEQVKWFWHPKEIKVTTFTGSPPSLPV